MSVRRKATLVGGPMDGEVVDFLAMDFRRTYIGRDGWAFALYTWIADGPEIIGLFAGFYPESLVGQRVTDKDVIEFSCKG